MIDFFWVTIPVPVPVPVQWKLWLAITVYIVPIIWWATAITKAGNWGNECRFYRMRYSVRTAALIMALWPIVLPVIIMVFLVHEYRDKKSRKLHVTDVL